MKAQIKIWKNPTSAALPITKKELIALGVTEAQIAAGEIRGDLKTLGGWQLPVAYRALCMSSEWTPEDKAQYTAQRDSSTLYGMRIMSSMRESGYAMEGRVSVGGKSVRAFTSSQLFELPDGKLISAAIIHACP